MQDHYEPKLSHILLLIFNSPAILIEKKEGIYQLGLLSLIKNFPVSCQFYTAEFPAIIKLL